MFKMYASVVIAASLLVGGIVVALPMLGLVEPVRLSAHGWFAFGLAVVLCLALSAGLFALSFYSARSGHDDIDMD